MTGLRLRAILFDAGGTLVFPSLPRTLAPLAALGVRPSDRQLRAAEAAAKSYLDTSWEARHELPKDYWDFYFAHLLQGLGMQDGEIKRQLIATTCTAANWQHVLPGTHEVLGRLRQRFRLGVISNSDGTVQQAFEGLGLSQHFQAILDSTVVGHEKPSPEIFRAALAALDVAPQESLYVGDVYAIDYVGATRIGMRAILMDVAGVYGSSQYPRVASLQELENRLAERNL